MTTRHIPSFAVALALLAATACDNSGTKASGDVAVDSIPETPQAYIEKSANLRREGKHKEAKEAALKAYTLAGSGPRVDERIELAKTFGAAGESASAINEIKQLENEKRESGVAVDEVAIAEVYAQIGDPNAVNRWLERALVAKSPKLAGLETNTDLDPFKTDPRWQTILASIPK